MKHQAMLINSIECFYLCGGSSIKCINNEIDNCNTQNMDITNFLSAEAIQPLHKHNYFLILLQGVYNHLSNKVAAR